MVKVIEKNSIKIGKEPMVILPLKRWEEIRELLEEQEEARRFVEAISDPKNKKLIPFKQVKRKLNLP